MNNTGYRNTGYYNTGNYNTGYANTGYYNTGNYNTGYYNTGDYNTGNYNTGYYNTGVFNFCNFSAGVFCTQEDKIRLFNRPSDMTASEFYDSKYYTAIQSAPFKLTEWISYTEEDMNTEEKRTVGGYLKLYTYKEACTHWWEKMREEDRQTVMSIPNFDKDIFFEITGVEV
jgi:hypothetical protein